MIVVYLRISEPEKLEKMKRVLFTLVLCSFLLTTSMGQAIQTDKVMHYSVGFIIGATTTSLLEDRVGKTKAIMIGFGVATVAGIAKELLYDEMLRKGNTETLDLGATMLGGLSGSIVITINL